MPDFFKGFTAPINTEKIPFFSENQKILSRKNRKLENWKSKENRKTEALESLKA
jgi:hypothetical protein